MTRDHFLSIRGYISEIFTLKFTYFLKLKINVLLIKQIKDLIYPAVSLFHMTVRISKKISVSTKGPSVLLMNVKSGSVFPCDVGSIYPR